MSRGVPSEDEFILRFDAEAARQSEAVRQELIAAGRPDLLGEYDEVMRLNRLGISGARNTWHSLSLAQRRVVENMALGAKLWRDPGNPKGYFLRTRGGIVQGLLAGLRLGGVVRVRVATVLNLAARDLVQWDGFEFDPEGVAILTEHARFVLKHGPTT